MTEQNIRFSNSADTILIVKDVLTRAVGEENFEMPDEVTPELVKRCAFEGTPLLGLPITIHYPKIVMTNEAGDSVPVRDVYVRFQIDRNSIVSPGLFSAVFASPSIGNSGIGAHPHGGSAMSFSHLCFGSGPLPDIVDMLNQDFTKQTFTAFIIAIKAYLEFENNEDRHTLINMQIDDVPIKPIYSPHAEHLADQALDSILKQGIREIINVTFDRGKFEVTSRDELELAIGKALKSTGYITGQCVKTTNGTYVYYSNQVMNSRHGLLVGRHLLEFKGKPVLLKLHREEDYRAMEAGGIRSHPQVTEAVCKIIAQKLNRYAITYKKDVTYGNNEEDTGESLWEEALSNERRSTYSALS